ncbi:DUF4352 domain-containing protein [uncultured Vagococcus sp.]|uniref:DUF4352 domain-containing protein n=1 Tax=uncultured Vagococcus sp. TaxID=189676 RepID=UPI0028D88ABB|nr:DUF4352 domain-containing protein [uncultured Vagococcus sp.]
MKKIIFLIGLVLVASLLIGCSAKVKKASKNDKDIGMTQRINKMDMTLNQVVTTNNQSKDTTQVMLVAEMSFKNTSKESIPVGANDFKIRDQDGEIYEIYGLEPDNFGEVVEPGKELTGAAYYELPKDTKNAVLVYQIESEPLGEWTFKVPNQKRK